MTNRSCRLLPLLRLSDTDISPAMPTLGQWQPSAPPFTANNTNPSAPQRPTTPTNVTVASLIYPAFPFKNHLATPRLALKSP
jgi:hypothetical protein